MKRIILSLLIVISCTLGTVAFGMDRMSAQKQDSTKVIDSLDIFRDITDIGKQVGRQTMKSADGITVDGDIVVEKTLDNRLVGTGYPGNLQRDSMILIRFKNPLDSIYLRKENGTLTIPEYRFSVESLRGFTFRDTLFYNPLFLPMIFTGEILPRDLSLYPLEKDADEGLLIPREKTFAIRLDHIDFVRNVRRDYYLEHPDLIKYSVASFDTITQMPVDDRNVRENFNPFRELIRAETTYSLEKPDVEKIKIGRKYWQRSGEHSFHFSQNYFSDNWHKGGTNNLNFISTHILKANYRKEKVRFNNTLEWRLSVFNAPDDSIRSYRIGNDLIRYYGDFGIDAFGKGWSYSTNLEAKSQLFKAFPVNSDVLRSSFLSPLYVNMGIGLKYSLNKPSTRVRHRNFNLALSIAPVSLNATYVMNDSVNVVRFGIPEGRNHVIDIGTTITATVKYKITNYITWDSNLTYFTSYEKVISGFENTLDMALSNAFSTKIYVNVRFDDGVPPDPKLNYWQLSNALSFGLSYKW